MRSKWQLGMLGTISAFAYRHKETKKALCRDGGGIIRLKVGSQ